jgi:stage V sporulation protein G
VKITEVRVKLVSGPESRREKLKAFCSVTFDDEFVVRDLKIIDGARGLFVAMPSRKLTTRCSKCGNKNPVRSRYCNECGKRQPVHREGDEGRGRRIYADVAHPIHAASRDKLHAIVIDAYELEISASQREGYVPVEFDDFDYDERPQRPLHHPGSEETQRPSPVRVARSTSPESEENTRELGASG